MVGEVNDAGALNLIGIGQAKSRGVRKGEIVDPALAAEDARAAIVEAEQQADVEISSVYLGVSGAHVRGFTNRGTHTIVSADRVIGKEDVDEVVKNARVLNLPAQHTIIHAIRQHFNVEGQEPIANPIGMVGPRLAVDVHVIHGIDSRFQNAMRMVRGLGLEVDGLAFNGLASALSLLTNDQKEVGALVIDIGGGTTEYVAYAEGIIKHAGVFAVGGDHITNDLAYGLKVPLSRAEGLKINYGSATMPEGVRGQTLSLEGDVGLPSRTLNREHFHRIMSMRVQEILGLIEDDLAQHGLLDDLRSGVFLCGGGAKIPNIAQAAENIFQLPAVAAQAAAAGGIKSALEQPEFATAIGLVKYGSFQEKEQRARGGLVNTLRSIKTFLGRS